MPPKNATPTSENEVHEEAVTARKFPRNAKWVPADDATLVDTLKAFADGNSADNGTFKTVAFTTAAKSLKDSHKLSGGAPKTAKTCSHRWATLKANCLVVQKLCELSGFGWDESKNIVVATDKVWDDY
ncbi:hypothetical protein M405DRAFT_937154, partial [Rhizopogon salebrosus TDB-379]